MSSRALLAVHGVLGLVSVLAVTRDAVLAVLSAVRRDAEDAGVALRPAGADAGVGDALRRFGWLSPAAVAMQFAVGLALYPAYRVRVRALDFDRHAPVYSQLFDFKEHLAALSLALVVLMAVASRGASAPDTRRPIAAVATTAAVFLWTVAILGVCVTARHAV